jgi:hypothetical protein
LENRSHAETHCDPAFRIEKTTKVRFFSPAVKPSKAVSVVICYAEDVLGATQPVKCLARQLGNKATVVRRAGLKRNRKLPGDLYPATRI